MKEIPTPLTDALLDARVDFRDFVQHARQLERDRHELIEELKHHVYHHECDDCWYSCATITCDEQRKSNECDCGADRVIALLERMKP